MNLYTEGLDDDDKMKIECKICEHRRTVLFLFFFFLVKNIVRVFSSSILSIVYPWSGTRMNFRGRFSFFQPLMHSCLSRIWKTSRLSPHSAGTFVEKFLSFFFFLLHLPAGKNLSDFFKKKPRKLVDFERCSKRRDIRII